MRPSNLKTYKKITKKIYWTKKRTITITPFMYGVIEGLKIARIIVAKTKEA